MESGKELKSLIDLYKECFNDGDEIVAHLFSEKLGSHNAVTRILKGEIKGALYIVDKPMIYQKKKITYPFIVAVGVNKTERGKGIAKDIVRKALVKCYSQRRAFVGLYPAINNFYEKLDFIFITKETKLKKENYDFKETQDIDLMLNLYNNATLKLDFFYERSKENLIKRIDEIKADFGKAELIYKDDLLVGFSLGGGEEYVLSDNINYDSQGEKINGHMARIVSIKDAFMLTDITIPFPFRIIDNMIPQNNKIVSVKKGVIKKEEKAIVDINIAELTALFFNGEVNAETKKIFSPYFKEIKGQIAEKY